MQAPPSYDEAVTMTEQVHMMPEKPVIIPQTMPQQQTEVRNTNRRDRSTSFWDAITCYLCVDCCTDCCAYGTFLACFNCCSDDSSCCDCNVCDCNGCDCNGCDCNGCDCDLGGCDC